MIASNDQKVGKGKEKYPSKFQREHGISIILILDF